MTISRRTDRVVVGLMTLLFGAIAIWNARAYPFLGGFDASHHVEYVHALLDRHELPTGGASYTPPGFYIVAAGVVRLGDSLGLDEPERLVQLVNAALGIGTLLLTLALARLLFPGRFLLHWSALAFFACCPVVLRTLAMFHPQPLAMFLSTAALTLVARMIVLSRYGLWNWVGVAMTLAASQLVRSVGLWTVAVVVLTLVITAILRREDRRKVGAGLGVAAAAAVLLALPWYVHLQRTSDSAVFGRNYSVDPFPAWIPAEFYVSPELPAVITDPHRGTLAPRYLPLLYAETWGDYFGIWSWNPPRPELTSNVNRRLMTQSIVGLPLTCLAVAGWLALGGLAVSRGRTAPALFLVVLMPLAGLVGTLYYGTRIPIFDGDTIKAMYLLTAVPTWAISFGFALDVLVRRHPWIGSLALGIVVPCLLISLAYGTYAFVS